MGSTFFAATVGKLSEGPPTMAELPSRSGSEKIDRLFASVPHHRMARRLRSGDDLASADDRAPGSNQAYRVHLGRRIKDDRVGAAAWLEPVLRQTQRACSVDADHVDQA